MLSGCGQSEPETPVAAAPDAVQAGPAAPVGATAASEPTTPPPFPVDSSVPPAEQVTKLLEGAQQFLKQGNAKLALEAINRAIKIDPTSVDARLRRAELFAAADLKTQAVEDLTKAIELEPRNARTFNTRGYLRMSQSDMNGAVEDFAAAISIDLEYPQPYNNRGLVRVSQGAPEKALLDFDAALRIDPKYIDAYNNRGYALTQLGRYEEAIETLTKAIEIDPTYVNAWNNRGLANAAAGKGDQGTYQLEAAVADFTKAIELQPSHTKYYIHRSEALTALQRLDEARADTDKAAWLERLSDLNRLVATSPDLASCWLQRAEHMRLGERFDAAMTDVNRAIQLLGPTMPEASDAYVLQARILLDQGQIEKAIESANTAAKIRPSDQVYSVRGDAHFKLQNYEAAAEDFMLSRRLDETVQKAFELRAAQLESAGQIEQAGYFREQASALSPDRLLKTAAAETAEPLPFPIDTAQPPPTEAPKAE
jgi:tetratricopeptide (TPR) repeat protein